MDDSDAVSGNVPENPPARAPRARKGTWLVTIQRAVYERANIYVRAHDDNVQEAAEQAIEDGIAEAIWERTELAPDYEVIEFQSAAGEMKR
jgi:hypothetical protein